MPPCRSIAAAAIACMSFHEATSPSRNAAEPPAPVIAATAASPVAASRPVISTLAPLAAKSRAMPLPIPLLPPVTTTDFPAIDVNMVVSPSVLLPSVTAETGVYGRCGCPRPK